MWIHCQTRVICIDLIQCNRPKWSNTLESLQELLTVDWTEAAVVIGHLSWWCYTMWGLEVMGFQIGSQQHFPWEVHFFSHRVVFWLLVPNNLPYVSVSVLTLPIFLLSSSLGEVHPGPEFLVHGMVMRSRCEIKMLWPALWHMMTGLGRSVKDLCTDEISPGQLQTSMCGN